MLSGFPAGRPQRAVARSQQRSGRLSQLQLNAALKELRVASELETVKVSVTIVELEAHILGQVPVKLLRESTESASADRSAVQVDVGIAGNEFPRPWSPAEHGSLRNNSSKESPDCVIRARLSRDHPGRGNVPAVKQWVTR